MLMNATREFLKDKPIKNWDILAADYSAGRDAAEKFQKLIKSQGGAIGKVLFAPFGTADFGAKISELGSDPADGLYVIIIGSDAINLVKQQAQFGLFQKYKMVVGNSFVAPQVLPAMGDGALGVYEVLGFVAGEPGVQAEAFVKAYKERYGELPPYTSADQYSAIQLIAAAINKANSTDVAAVRGALAGIKMETVVGDIEVRAADHQAARPVVVSSDRSRLGRQTDVRDQAHLPRSGDRSAGRSRLQDVGGSKTTSFREDIDVHSEETHLKLAGKAAIVTGAARGLGRAYALRLAALGADVAVVDIDLNAASEYGEALSAESVPAEIKRQGRRSLGIQADLTRRDEGQRAIREAYEAFGRLDILVNNAGGALTPAGRSHASESPEEDTRFLLDVNYMSAVHCCQAAAPLMKAQRSGVIVNISSQSGISTYQRGLLAAYAAAKAAVTTYTRYLAAELGPFGIRANCLAPGIMMTSRVAAQAVTRGVGTNDEAERIPLRRFGEVEDCAGVLEFLATDLSRYVTGQVISVCGGAVLTPN